MVTDQAPASAAARLREAFASGRFVFTAELDSPSHASTTQIERQARGYAPYVDAINCTDNAGAVVRISPVAAAAIVARTGLAPLVQLTCRDRNRIALQSDALGAAAVGAAGVVCMTGDPPGTGNQPDAKEVFDLTSAELMAAVRGLCEGRFLSGDPVTKPPDLLVGAVENPAEGERSIGRLAAKVDAGVEFVQTQITFDAAAFAGWMELVRAAGLHERVRILAGIATVRRPSTARYLHEHIPGVTVPDATLTRLESAEDPEAEGVRVAAELLQTIRAIPGVAGAHLMTFGWVGGVERVLRAAE
ncbi:MAG: methylenetetrahydrofolate reductase [Dehalococcoidia bacterium]